MGCAPSRGGEDLPLVTFCRERKQLIKSAADHRFSLAAAHIAYFSELRHVGDSLCRFVEEELILSSAASTPSSLSSLSSPVLTLPSDEGKGKGKGGEAHTNKQKKKKTNNNNNNGQNGNNNVRHVEGGHLDLSSFSSSDRSSSTHHHHHEHHEHEHHGHESGHLEIDEDEEEEEKEQVKQVPTYPQPGISYIPPPADNNFYSSSSSYPYYPSNYPPVSSAEDNNNGFFGNPYYPAPPYYYPSSDYYPAQNYGNSYGGGSSTSYTAYYMKKSSTRIPSMIYQEPQQNPIYSYSEYPPSGDYPDYPTNVGPTPGHFGYMLNNHQEGSVSVSNRQQQNQQQRAPPPPSPPKVSAWDYFNPFEGGAYYGYEAGYVYEEEESSSSPDSREVREREGIPDLEEETESEITKESSYIEQEFSHPKSRNKNKTVQFEDLQEPNKNHGNNMNNMNKKKKRNKKSGGFGEGTSKGGVSMPMPMHDHHHQPKEEQEQEHEREPVEVKSSSPEDSITSISTSVEEVSVKKKGVSFDMGGTGSGTSHLDIESSKPSSLTTLSAHGTRDLREVVREIKDEFEAATDYGKEVSVLLEVNKEPYKSRSTFLKVMLARICSTSLSSYHSPAGFPGGYPGAADNDLDSNSLATTLEKLYAWEKKLYKEVKDEEKLRVMYVKQCERLKDLDERGAEISKIEATQATIRKLLTKINVSVRAIDTISSRIHRLRDEELQPQLKELIYGLRRMWKLLLKCHQKQFQAILESKTRALKANTGLRRDSSVRATIQLEAELLKWCHRFHHWIEMQRSYAETLNDWLEKCLHYEPEITPDGEVPYSPGRIGAPLAFVTCHDWKQAMERVSESAVQTAMNDFATCLHQLWERQDEEQRQRLAAEKTYKDFEKQIRALKMERQGRGHGEDEPTLSDKNSMSMVASESGISALDDLKVDLDSIKQRVKQERAGHKEAMKLVHDAVSRSIQAGLVPIFEALESFTSEASKAFDEVRLEHDSGYS